MTDNPPAFPQLSVESGKRDGHGDMIEPFTASQAGATMRDLYAMAALQGLLVAGTIIGRDQIDLAVAVKGAFDTAELMLAERAKR